jgi:hypothetical protein
VQLYTQNRAAGAISEASGYPRRPFRKDLLNDIERFILLKDMGEAVGLIDANGNAKLLTQTEASQSVLYLSMKVSKI